MCLLIYFIQKEVRMCEASPDGNVVLMAEVMNSRIIRVNWTRPEYANGLLFFEVYVQGSFYVDPGNFKKHNGEQDNFAYF